MGKEINLCQDKSYEWFGSFWFDEDDPDVFSGILTYSQEHGLRLKLSTVFKRNYIEEYFEKKVMFGVISDNNLGLTPNNIL